MIFLRKDRGKLGLFLISAAFVVIVDQASKSWIRANPHPRQLLPGFIDLIYSWNPGAVFGLLANQTLLVTISIIVLIVIIFLLLRYLYLASTLTLICAGLIFGGAVGNLIDRLRFSGCVTDFIDMHLTNLFHWPWLFNFADAAIVIGICALACFLVRSELFGKACDHNRKIKD